MGPFRIVKLEIGSYPEACFRNVPVIVKVDLFVFDGAPKPFNKNVVINPAPAIHADSDAALFKHAKKIYLRELCPLVDIENLRL